MGGKYSITARQLEDFAWKYDWLRGTLLTLTRADERMVQVDIIKAQQRADINYH